MPFTIPRTPSLSKDECVDLTRHLDACTAIFERRTGSLTSAEVRMKTMVAVLRNEVHQHVTLLAAMNQTNTAEK